MVSLKKNTKKFEQKLENMVRSMNELKDVFMELDDSDYKTITDNWNLNHDLLIIIERFNTLKDDILNDNKKNDIVASMKVINEGTQTKIQLGEKEYVLPMSSEFVGNHYCFPNAKEPMFALSVNALEGIITVGTKDEKVKQYLLSLKDEGLKITDNGKSATFQSTYDVLPLHHKLIQTLVDSMQVSKN
jgi:hypothetical protein